jgi:hypothetical protein
VTFARTELLGIYTATPILDPNASPAPGASAAPSAGASASAPPVVDPYAPVRFAVDLFDVGESTIAPGSASRIEDLGTAAGASPAPGTAGSTAPATTRDELWVPILLIVLLVLCVEWAVYHRDAVIRIRRSLAARMGRTPADGSA